MAGACFGFGRAKDAQGFDWTALAQGPLLVRGWGKKKGGSQGTRSGKAKRRLPFTPASFLRNWKRGHAAELSPAGSVGG